MRTALQPRTYDKEGLRAGDREEPVNLDAVWPTRHRNQFSRTALRAWQAPARLPLVPGLFVSPVKKISFVIGRQAMTDWTAVGSALLLGGWFGFLLLLLYL
jgi:hypothetical protein